MQQPGLLGLRITHYPALVRLLQQPELPEQLLWASSANASGAPPCCTAQAAQAWLAEASKHLTPAKLGGELAEEVLAAVNQVLERAGLASSYSLTLIERRQALQGLFQPHGGPAGGGRGAISCRRSHRAEGRP